jgi:hypothetical protein
LPRSGSRVRVSFPAPYSEASASTQDLGAPGVLSFLAVHSAPPPSRPGGRVVMQRPAKPCTPVRFRPRPPSIDPATAPHGAVVVADATCRDAASGRGYHAGHARVAKSVAAADLKSAVPRGPCRFESGPGHQPAKARAQPRTSSSRVAPVLPCAGSIAGLPRNRPAPVRDPRFRPLGRPRWPRGGTGRGAGDAVREDKHARIMRRVPHRTST